MQRINIPPPTQALRTVFEMLLHPLALLLKTFFTLFLQKWFKPCAREKGLGEDASPTPDPEEPESVGEAREAFGGGDRENEKLPDVQEKPVHWLLSSDSRQWIGGMTASPSAHFTCQLNFFGLTS